MAKAKAVTKHVSLRLHRKAGHIHTLSEAIGSIIFAVETSHALAAFFFVAWAALDLHEIFWGLES